METLRISDDTFKLSTHPNSTLNINKIRSILDKWEEREGFVPDVILIDYADILAPERNNIEFRHQQNESWKAMRALSQERHACVLTVTQAAATSYGKANLDLSDFSEDKRKYAHVTGMFVLNQTPEEKRSGIIRFGALMVREDAFDINHNVHVLQCLQIGRPYISSY